LENRRGVALGKPFIYLSGYFKNPGSIAWTNGITLKDAIEAGAISKFAPHSVLIIHADGSSVRYRLNEDFLPTNNPVLERDDNIAVPRE
jgi:hypothetical protein